MNPDNADKPVLKQGALHCVTAATALTKEGTTKSEQPYLKEQTVHGHIRQPSTTPVLPNSSETQIIKTARKPLVLSSTWLSHCINL